MSELREALADLCHRQWSGWMEYMFSPNCIQTTKLNEKVIKTWAVERWTRQMQTPYAALSEAEKDSDRKEAEKILAVVRVFSEYKVHSEAAEQERDDLRAKLDAALAREARLREAVRAIHDTPCAHQRCAERDGFSGCLVCEVIYGTR